MCEDRALQMNRGGVNARAGRIQHVRPRPHGPRRMRAALPNQQRERDPSSDSSDEEHYVAMPASPPPAVHIPNFNYPDAQRYEIYNRPGAEEPWYKYRTTQQTRRDNLMEIAMRTVMLMRQNQQLQQKLAALQAETKVFMQDGNHQENRRAQAEALARAQAQFAAQDRGQAFRVHDPRAQAPRAQYPQAQIPQAPRAPAPQAQAPHIPQIIKQEQDIPQNMMEMGDKLQEAPVFVLKKEE